MTPGVPVDTSGYQEDQDQISGANYISDVIFYFSLCTAQHFCSRPTSELPDLFIPPTTQDKRFFPEKEFKFCGTSFAETRLKTLPEAQRTQGIDCTFNWNSSRLISVAFELAALLPNLVTRWHHFH